MGGCKCSSPLIVLRIQLWLVSVSVRRHWNPNDFCDDERHTSGRNVNALISALTTCKLSRHAFQSALFGAGQLRPLDSWVDRGEELTDQVGPVQEGCAGSCGFPVRAVCG